MEKGVFLPPFLFLYKKNQHFFSLVKAFFLHYLCGKVCTIKKRVYLSTIIKNNKTMTNSTQITGNQGVLRFDNSKMTKETKSTILEMISDKRFKEVENELFGLFDGFYYVDTLMEFCKESKLTTKYDLLMMLGFLHELDKRYEEI